METPVYLNRIEIAVPPYECHGEFVRAVPKLIPSEDLREKVEKSISRLGIERRFTVLQNGIDFDGNRPEAFYRFGKFPSIEQRMQVYQDQALPLASLALEPLLAKINRESITHLLLTSCTGFYAPGIDIDIVRKFRLSPSVERTLIGFMGCYAAIPALKLARRIVRSETSAKVLIVNLEMCTLHWREDVPLDQWISFLLFADGCAASLVSAEAGGIRLDGFFSDLIPDSLDLMRWTIGDNGFYMKLDAQIPKALRQGLRSGLDKVLHGKPLESIQSWAVHPGGRSIVDAVREELGLEERQLRHSREVLRDYGNMSSPTVMFVLKKIMEDPACRGPGCGMAFGPGLTLESFTYQNREDA